MFSGLDIVDMHIQDIKNRLSGVPSILGKYVHLYTQDQLLEEGNKLNFPAVGITYNGLAPIDDRLNPTGRINITLVYIDKPRGYIDTGEEVISATKVLAEMRKAMNDVITDEEKKWTLTAEIPTISGGEGEIAFLQRWYAVVTTP